MQRRETVQDRSPEYPFPFPPSCPTHSSWIDACASRNVYDRNNRLAKYKERYESLLEELELVYLQKDELASELTAARSKLDVGKSVHALKLEQYVHVVGEMGF
jgi:hypothetical protein